jgi:choline dehydrogenase-like flavoprotein
MSTEESMTYDYVIVGSGAAGSVLAARLSADPANNVLLLESGGSDRNPIHLVPKGFYFTLTNPRYTKTFVTEPYGDDYVNTFPRGRIVGGSTTINGMIWNRGWAPRYDAWEQAGNKGWNWERFLAAFKALENHELGGSALRGGNGPVAISIAKPRDPVSDAFISALAKHGVGLVDDMNSSGDERVAYVASNIKRGTRVSASRAFLRTARRRRNLTVLEQTEVDRITFEGTVATGVEATQHGKTVRFFARREVLVCAGALDSPLLLERSGIGNPKVLTAAGIPVVVASRKVGENMNDHRGSLMFQLRMKGDTGFNREINSAFRQGWTAFKYLFTRTGVMSFGGYNVCTMFKSDPASQYPDTQGFFTPMSSSSVDPNTGRVVIDGFSGAMFIVLSLYPTSVGSIHITGSRTSDKPRLVADFLTTEHDRALTIKMFNKSREILATEPFAQMIESEMEPGSELWESADVLKHALKRGGGGFHTVGTCAIGPSDDDVVDDRLRVRGTSHLRVVDASVFPVMPSGNNNAPTQAMAWIAADLILEDAR